MTLSESNILDSLRPAHPRLILLPGAEAGILHCIQTDPLAQHYYARLLVKGQQLLTLPPEERRLEGREPAYMFMLHNSREILDRIYTLGLLYRLTGEQRWAERGIVELLHSARFVDWNPAHWLDTAELFHAQALGYDWFYSELSPAQRHELEQAALRHGFDEAEKAFREKAWWTRNAFNWNNVCNGGIIAGVLGFAELAPERAAALITQAIANLPAALASFAPDGAWAEGPAYWGYAMRYTQTALACLQTALGNEFGLGELPGMPEAGWFRMHGVGPFGLFFDFADAGLQAPFEPALFWLGRRYAQPAFTQAGIDSDRPVIHDAPFGALARALIFYDPPTGPVVAAAADAHYQKTHLAFFRSAWNDPQAAYLGFKGGDNKANHSHCDLGVFVFDALGERWAIELGRDDYTLPGYWHIQGKRWSYTRLATPGHNTLVLDGQNQDPTAEAPISDFGSDLQHGYAVADLTQAYALTGATKVLRRVELDKARLQLQVSDQVQADRPVQVTWQIYTQAGVTLQGSRAQLVQNGKTMHLEVLSPAAATWQVEEISLEPPQLPLENTRRVYLHLPPALSAEIHVRLGPAQSA